jgi:hypothetical protein
MEKEKQPYVCPAEYAGRLDNPLRKLVHNPRKILMPQNAFPATTAKQWS